MGTTDTLLRVGRHQAHAHSWAQAIWGRAATVTWRASLRLMQAEELLAVRGGKAFGVFGSVVRDQRAVWGPASPAGHGRGVLLEVASGASPCPGESDIF